MKMVTLSTFTAAWFVLVGAPSWAAPTPDPAACIVANEAGVRLRSEHKLSEAHAQLLRCLSAACPYDVRQECQRVSADVDAAMPTIVFEVKDTSGRILRDVNVAVDGQHLTDALDGTALQIDPGRHELTFVVGDLAPVKRRFVLNEGAKGRHETVVVGAAARPGEAGGNIRASNEGRR